MTAAQLHEIYEATIDLGAHPSQLGAMGAMASIATNEQVTFSVGILHPAPLQVLVTLRTVVSAGVGALKIFEKIFPERSRLIGLADIVESLVVQLNTTFLKYRMAPANPPHS